MNVRLFNGGDLKEVYLSAGPSTTPGDTFASIRKVLEEAGAVPFQERVFVTDGTLDEIAEARHKAYGPLDDGLDPAWLKVERGAYDGLVGVQVHAVSAPGGVETLRVDDCYARVARRNGHGFVSLTGVAAPQAGTPPEQAGVMLRNARKLLQQAGGDMTDVARTWMWLGDILSWYGSFNEVRTAFFHECGLLGGTTRLPASTGIGIGPARAGTSTMDLVAVVGKDNGIGLHTACGRQRSAYNYGSAFSRAATAPTPAGTAVYVSGTAAINERGETVHLGDVEGQTVDTIENVRAVLEDLGCSDDDVVQAIVYCKTPDIEKRFLARADKLAWPHFTAVADVCRDDLLIEIEALAVRPDDRRETSSH